jgi:tryptophan halogenase
LPALHTLNRLLGLSEGEMVAASNAVPAIAQRYSDWGRPPFLIGYDTSVPGSAEIGFLHYWLKARGEGLNVALEQFSLAAAAAGQGRLPGADQDLGPLAAAPGYDLDAIGYVRLLRRTALAAGVELVTGRLAAVERQGEAITALRLEDGERLSADLYVDASGAEAVLIGDAPGAERESWAAWLPCNRLLAASGPRIEPLPAFSEMTAFAAGWVGLYPLQHRTAVVAAYSSDDLSDAEMLEALPRHCPFPITGDAFVTTFAPGVRARPWIGNVVAIGDAAASVEPLDGSQLHFVHVGISHLVTLFPVDAERPLEAEVYNRAMASHAIGLRDFQAAHYKLNQRAGEDFWDRVRCAEGPETLDAKIRAFVSRGVVPLNENETFQEQAWTASFLGHGLMPASHDPRVALLPREQHIEKVQKRLRDVAAAVRAMPTVESWLAAVAPGRG